MRQEMTDMVFRCSLVGCSLDANKDFFNYLRMKLLSQLFVVVYISRDYVAYCRVLDSVLTGLCFGRKISRAELTLCSEIEKRTFTMEPQNGVVNNALCVKRAQ